MGIRKVTGRGAWLDPLPRERRVVFPGYASLMELSAAHGDIFRENLGSGWASYFRPGNVLIAFPPGAGHQERLDEMLRASLALNHPVVLWLINFPAIDINHAVLVYSVQRRGDRSVYGVYDPNDAKASRELTYDSSERAFSFEATFYFLGGELDARAIYQDFLR